jgi:chemotaxis protein MotB
MLAAFRQLPDCRSSGSERAVKKSTRRRRFNEEHENPERWLVSYADFITLLFAFFVVMYALSSINEGKYRVLSDSLVTAFRSSTSDGGGATILTQPQMTTLRPVNPKARNQALQLRDKQAEQMKKVARSVSEAMAPYATQGQVAVIESDRGITVEINDSLLFAAGRAELAPSAEEAIRNVGRIFAETEFPVTIEGHTDNTPISTAAFPSNWELSAVRATTVLRLMASAGVAPGRLTAIGYGEQRPVAENVTPEGRSRNRRVAIQLEASLPAVPGVTPSGR